MKVYEYPNREELDSESSSSSSEEDSSSEEENEIYYPDDEINNKQYIQKMNIILFLFIVVHRLNY